MKKIIVSYEIIDGAIQIIGRARDSARDAPKLAVSAAGNAKEDNFLEMPDHALIMEIADEASDTERRQIVFVATWVAGESLYQAASLVPGLEALFDAACRIRGRFDGKRDEPAQVRPSRRPTAARDQVFHDQVRRRKAGIDQQYQLRKELEETRCWRLLPRETIAFAVIRQGDPDAEARLAADEAALAEQTALVAKFLDALTAKKAVVSAYNDCFRRSRAAGVPFGDPIRELTDDQIKYRPIRLIEYVEAVKTRIAAVDEVIDAVGNVAPAAAKPVEAPKPPPVEAAPLKPAPTAAPAVATTEPATPTAATAPVGPIAPGYKMAVSITDITPTEEVVSRQLDRVNSRIPSNTIIPNLPRTMAGVMAKVEGDLRKAHRLVYELEIMGQRRVTGHASVAARAQIKQIETFLGIKRPAPASVPAPANASTDRDASAAA